MGTRTKDEIVRKFLLSNAERRNRPKGSTHKKLRAKASVGPCYHYSSLLTVQAMRSKSRTLSSQWPTDDQVMAYLTRHDSTLPTRLDAAPRYVKVLFDNQFEASRQGWFIQGRPSADTLWTFWLRAYDLDHIEYLGKANAALPAEPEVGIETEIGGFPDVLNRFDALGIDSSPPLGQVKYEGLADDSFNFMFDQLELPVASTRLRLASGSSSSAASFTDTRPTTPGTPVELAVSAADALGTRETFLRYFGYVDLPGIPCINRPLEALLVNGDVWGFSRQERAALSEHIAIAAKEGIEEEMLKALEKAVRDYETVRKAHEEARNEVSVGHRRQAPQEADSRTWYDCSRVSRSSEPPQPEPQSFLRYSK